MVPTLWAFGLLGSIAMFIVTATTEGSALELVFVVTIALTAAMAHRILLSWTSLTILLVGVILFIPIRRYTVPVDLPFELEPYRILITFVAAGWLASLLVDPRVRLRSSGFEGPLALIFFAAVGSVLANPTRVQGTSDEVVKKLMFLVSFLLVFYVVVSVLRSPRDVDRLLKVLVVGGAVLALVAVVEARTGWNPFNRLNEIVPLLDPVAIPDAAGRGGRLRAYASAQHPIALGAALAILVPLAIYLQRRTRQNRWWWATGALLLGAVATVSRTAILMLVVMGLVFLWLRPRETRRLWPLVIPALLVVHLVAPGTIGALRKSFFPEGGLITEQQSGAGTRGSGRVADLGPGLSEWSRTPVLGQGYGTRVIDEEKATARILDNQWLATLLETGAAGFFGWIWLLARVGRRLVRRAREDISDCGWLPVALAASIISFAVGMLTYDAFAFIQVTFLLFLIVGFASVTLVRPMLGRPVPVAPSAKA